MTLEEFLRLGAAMRDAQKNYFALGGQVELSAAMKLERLFDRALLEIMGRMVTGMQPLPGFTELSDPTRGD